VHDARDLVVDSVTGVDLTLPVAGPGARSYAFLIDWLIRAILFTAWYGVAALLYNRRWTFIAPLNPDAKWFVLVVTPAAAMYFLYHFVLEIAMHGRTPGKRMAGIHIATRTGGSPGIGALLARNVFRLVDSLPLLYGVGLVTAFATRDHVRIGDMAAGTILVYERPDIVLPEQAMPAAASRAPALSRSDAEVITELLTRWPQLESEARQHLAAAILARHRINVAARPGRPPDAAAPPTRGASTAQTDTDLRSQLERLLQGTPT
jgi:uncharacterized RDD family membrane protein YckC